MFMLADQADSAMLPQYLDSSSNVRAPLDAAFPYARWNAMLPTLAAAYRAGEPFPHVHLSNFFDAAVVDGLIDAFARTTSGPWIQWKHYNEHKSGLNDWRALPPYVSRVLRELNSDPFVQWLGQLTGIEGLLADPTLEGGGMHNCGRGGFLHVHADFTRHHHHPEWRRRVNLIVYLNRGWQPEWGGALELWDRRMQRAHVRIPPLANDAVIFATDDCSYHGFPDPVTCPEGVMRRSLALYYYTVEREGGPARATNYRARPGDGWRTQSLIWADKELVAIYSRIKSAFGLSDDFASRTLGQLSRWRRR
jgi:hypothetical protein